MPGWNFADAWEVVAQQVPDAPAQVQGDRRISWRDFDRRANGVAQALPRRRASRSRTRSPSTSTTAPSTSSRCSRTFKAGPRARQHELPLPRRRARLPLGQRRRRGGGVPRHLRRAHRGHPRPAPPRQAVALGRRRQRPVPRRGPRPTRPAAEAGTADRGAGPVGPRRRPPAAPLHRRHHRHAQGRDVAPGRPVPHPRRHLHPGGARRRPRPRRSSATPSQAPGHDRPAGLPAHARHRLLHAAHRAVGRRAAPSPSRAATSTSTSCSPPSSASR